MITRRTLGSFPLLILATAIGAQGPTWYRRSVGTTPPLGLAQVRLVHDTQRAVTLLAGSAGGVIQTWAWDGAQWRLLDPSGSMPRGRFELVYDSARKVCVGVFADGGTLETWEWGSSAWYRRTVTNPPRRLGFSIAYDSTRQRIVFFGGYDGNWNLADTYEFDNVTWTQRGSGGPVGRTDAAMAYDPARQRTVLFGGLDERNQPRWFADTWEWNGSTWVEAFGVTGPSARRLASMVFDSQRQRSVLCGGTTGSGNAPAGTWEWDGTTWKSFSAAPQPPAVYESVLAYDTKRRTVLFYGWNSASTPGLEFWERVDIADPVARWTAFGSGCAGSAGTPALAAEPGSLPWIGGTLQVRATNLPTNALRVPFGILGASNSSWGTFTLPLDLGFAGMQGCSLHVSLDVIAPLTAGSGSALWSIPIPAETLFVGQRFFQQVLVLDPGANVLGITLANAGEARIGVK